ncbi:hypothetical protein BB560_004357 [Smittium megazygosporum]|uniref:Post-GPI attachment to proteins factor 3 n=1 Tax=Smittium megazygosporum TaxID=133381 RepID=A0A2T9Z9H1_9FUNG|nr:hypothetical protein BB560_004357 [Smittium megazygosporum]
MRKPALKLILLLSFLITCTFASSGDRQPQFQSCLSNCIQKDCVENPIKLPLSLRLTLWSCEDNCKYTCQRAITVEAQKIGNKIHQYYGKWPFKRFLGLQEPASVLFSMWNGYYHLINWKLIDKRVGRENPAYFWLKLYVVIGVWTWVWSSIFHSRDYIFTERMDYFSAALLVLYVLFIPVAYLLRNKSRSAIKLLANLLMTLYLLHVFYLQFVKFDYSYNMIANALLGVAANVAWFIVAFKLAKSNYKEYYVPIVLMICTDLAFSLEAFDFPPILDTFDAHSLWHAATIPITCYWYRWLIETFSKTHQFKKGM